jgi:hypothetical protein
MQLLDPYKPEYPLFPLGRGKLAGLWWRRKVW